MYVDVSVTKRGNKEYKRVLLRTSYREEGKVRHKTILNLSKFPKAEQDAMILAFRHKHNLSDLVSLKELDTTIGKSIGSVWVINELAKSSGIAKALGKSKEGRLALLQVISRVIAQGSRLSSVRFAKSHAVCEILDIENLNEDKLYDNLSWLSANQKKIEKVLFSTRFPRKKPSLFLYDVTSSYLEGHDNEFAMWGYNRDKKKGKKQIVIGLLTGPDGLPIAVRVFKGNTADTKTVSEQVRTLALEFGVKNVTLVGDRGMLKGPQINSLPDDFRYITAISKPQILKLLSEKILKQDLFTEEITELSHCGIRYILKRNPLRKAEISEIRDSKLTSLKILAKAQTKYLLEHPQAKLEKAISRVESKLQELKISSWASVVTRDSSIEISVNEKALEKISFLDGCYVIKTDISSKDASKEEIHSRYGDLQKVERLFRTFKTSHLELRPVYVRKKESTEGHVFVVMLSVLLQRKLEEAISKVDITVEEAIDRLSKVCMQESKIKETIINKIPKPEPIIQEILKKLNVELPVAFPQKNVNVYTKKKLIHRTKN